MLEGMPNRDEDCSSVGMFDVDQRISRGFCRRNPAQNITPLFRNIATVACRDRTRKHERNLNLLRHTCSSVRRRWLALAACRLFFSTNEMPLLSPLLLQPPPPELARPVLSLFSGPSSLSLFFRRRRIPEDVRVLVTFSLPSTETEADPACDEDLFLPAPRKLRPRRRGVAAVGTLIGWMVFACPQL